MTWQDRDYAADENPMRRFGRPGGDWQGLRPSFDNPVTWSIPAGRIFRISIRVHVIFLIFIVIELLRAGLEAGAMSVRLAGLALAALFAIVLLHELGHCLACRWAGGAADEILMWPLGGLAYCRPPNRWQAHLVTVLGGPAVNVALAAVMIPVLGLATGAWWGVAVANPLYFDGLFNDAVSRSWVLTTLYLASQINIILLLFNLLPIFPLDGGRIAQALLWPKLGYAPSMRLAVRVGYLGAIGLGIMGFVIGNLLLVGVAIFGGITCYITHRQLALAADIMGFESDDYASTLYDAAPPPKRTRPSRRQQRRARREQQELQCVDAILKKIGDSGMESLTRAEKRWLKRATDTKRKT